MILNSIISVNTFARTYDFIEQREVYPQKESIIRSIGFIRFIIFLFAVEYFFNNSKKFLAVSVEVTELSIR